MASFGSHTFSRDEHEEHGAVGGKIKSKKRHSSIGDLKKGQRGGSKGSVISSVSGTRDRSLRGWADDDASSYIPTRHRWMPDNASKTCIRCKAPFNLLRRRHHCRLCGMLYCSLCCSNFIDLPDSDVIAPPNKRNPPHRCCDSCIIQAKEKQQQQNYVQVVSHEYTGGPFKLFSIPVPPRTKPGHVCKLNTDEFKAMITIPEGVISGDTIIVKVPQSQFTSYVRGY